MNKKLKTMLTVFSLGVGGSAIYILPYIKYVFYDQQMEVMNMTNAQSGMLLSVFAITAVILFPLGGIIADKIASKKLMIFSLVATTILTVLYAVTLEFKTALLIWVGLAITTGTTWWPSLVKAVGKTGSEEDSGKMYGIYYACNGVMGSVINSVALWFSTKGDTTRQGFVYAMIVTGVFTAVAAIMIFAFYNEDGKETAQSDDEKFKFSDVGGVVRNPFTWILAVIIFVSYSLFSSTSYFNPYLIDVVGISPESSGVYSIIRYAFMLLAPVGGWMCDRVLKTTARWFMLSSVLIGLLTLGVMMIPSTASEIFASVYTLLPAAVTMAQYGVIWSIKREVNISAAVLGTAIGISSCISWLPDLFMHTMFGHWLDTYGNAGYRLIFIYLTVLAVVGLVCGFIVQRSNSKKKATN